MNTASRFAIPLALIAGVAGCGGIGDGNTIKQLKIVATSDPQFEQGVLLDADTADERFHMYDCFCSNIAVLATFTDGTVANFSNRVTFSTDQPGIVTVLNYGERDTAACPFAQTAAGLLIPRGTLGTATITAEFAGLTDTLKVEVADASVNADTSPATYVLEPTSTGFGPDVAVGANLPLRVLATLDGRTRVLNRNVLTWSLDDENDDLATINSIGFVRGIAPTGASPMVARASFGTCSDVSPTLAVNVGDILGPLTLEREAPEFASDGLLAVSSDELLQVTAPLDFDGDGGADGSQPISFSIGLSFTDTCTLVDHDPADTTGTSCRTQTGQICSSSPATPVCSESAPTSCAADMTACRTAASSMLARGGDAILAVSDDANATNFTAGFPASLGTATTLAADVDDTTTSITVTELTGYPTLLPWWGVIDQGGTREDVRVTAVSGTALTVARGVSGTTAVAHASGASFAQRGYTSDAGAPLAIRAKEGALTVLAIDPPGTLASLGSLQLSAQGTFEDAASAQRTQRVTRLLAFASGSATVSWLTSDSSVAVVSTNGGTVFSTGTCGGRVSVRARASTSTDSTTGTFDSATTADDDACKNTDPLCDQVELCVATPSPLPLGTTCDTVTTCP
jgi:hypothetical protein